MPTADDTTRKWWTLGIVCVGTFMLLLDVTIVNVALPSIKRDLGFSQASLAWVVKPPLRLSSFGRSVSTTAALPMTKRARPVRPTGLSRSRAQFSAARPGATGKLCSTLGTRSGIR